MNILLFPGQGSQSKGMGKELFDQFSDKTNRASEILEYDLKDLCLNDPENKLNLTQFTQPALYAVNALAWFKRRDDGNPKPDCALGHSLGEYNALLAAGVFDFETGLKLVQKRGELMGKASGGGMAAVLKLPAERIREILDENDLGEIDLANFNTPTQIVISGRQEAIKKAVSVLGKTDGRVIPLRVSAPFHSRYMESASRAFADFLKGFTFNPPEFTVVANATARPYESGKVAELLAGQIVSPVLWTDSIRYLMGKSDDLQFTELNAAILTRMVDEIRKTCTPLIVPEPKEPVEETPKVSEAKGEKEEPKPAEAAADTFSIKPEDLGNRRFREKYGLRYAYVAGAMYRGIGSKEIVVKMGRAGMIGYLGTGGLSLGRIEEDIRWIRGQLSNGESYGMNLLYNLVNPRMEEDTVDLYLKYGVRFVEAAAYLQMSPALVRYRLTGLRRDENGRVVCGHHVLAKCSRPEIAEQFMSPAPERVVKLLVEKGAVTAEQAEMAKEVPMSHEICVEADSGGHTDMGVPTVILPAMQSLRKQITEKYAWHEPIFMGLAGGIGAPESALAAFVMGADFILTGSINQCTVESGASEAVKDMLHDINVQDTEYAPAGDMFEMGAKVQVLRRGVFFPARGNKLWQLYTQFDGLDQIPEKTRRQIQERYFKRNFEDIWQERKTYLTKQGRENEIEKAEKNPKQKMASVFRWYFGWSTKLALEGDPENTVDYQVHTGPALGAFNQWIKGTELEKWRNRHVDKIALRLLEGTVELLKEQMEKYGY